MFAALMSIIALLFWLEWLGSEQPQRQREVPVSVPETKTKTGPKIDT